MANGERLTAFTDLEMIDSIVKNSQGAYNHDDVFELSLDFTYKITLMYYERAMYQLRYNYYEKELTKP